MGKYTNANRCVRNMAINKTGQFIFNDDDPRILEIVDAISKRKGIPVRELHRQYRHYRNRIQAAAKEYIKNTTSITEVALKHQVCAKVLSNAINQRRAS